MNRLRVLFSMVALVASAGVARAQDTSAPAPEHIGLFAADVRVAFPKYKGSSEVAAGLGVDPLDLPGRGLGLVVGAHVYPLRKGVVTFGIGGEVMTGGRSRTQPAATEGGAAGPTVHTHFSSIAPQVSLNFGSKEGWSYLSAGLGSGRFTTELVGSTLPEAGRVKVINYGGGARWFARPHLALSLDLRFYAVNPQEASQGRPAFPRMTSVTMSAGVSVK